MQQLFRLGVVTLKGEHNGGSDSAEEKATGLLRFLRGEATMCDTRLNLNEYNGNFDENVIPPIKSGALDFVKKLSENFNVKLFTTRNNLLAQKWLKENKLDCYIKEVTNIKSPAYLHVDERCICHAGDFAQTLEKIKNFKVYWKNE